MARRPHLTKNRLIVTLVIAAVFVVICVLAFRNHTAASPAQTPSIPLSSPSVPTAVLSPSPTTQADVPTWHLDTCGPVEIDSLTVIDAKTKAKTPIKAAVFYPYGCRTKTSGCVYAGPDNAYPDPACTPSAIYDLSGYFGTPNTDPATFDQAKTRQVICNSLTTGRRSVAAKVKTAVYAEYGVISRKPNQYEVDHVISLELGGANVIGNLGAEIQPSDGTPGKNNKDKAEGYLHTLLCGPNGNLQTVTDDIVHHWLDYQQGSAIDDSDSN